MIKISIVSQFGEGHHSTKCERIDTNDRIFQCYFHISEAL